MALPRTCEEETPTDGLCARAARTIDDVAVLAVMVAIFLQFGRNSLQDWVQLQRIPKKKKRRVPQDFTNNIMYPNKVCPAHHITWIGRAAPHLISAIVGVQPPSSTCDIIQL